MEAWYDSFFNHTNDNINFLSELLYRGKIIFLMSETMPKTSLERLLRYSSTDLSWCENSEASIWAFLIENDLCFQHVRKIIDLICTMPLFQRECHKNLHQE